MQVISLFLLLSTQLLYTHAVVLPFIKPSTLTRVHSKHNDYQVGAYLNLCRKPQPLLGHNRETFRTSIIAHTNKNTDTDSDINSNPISSDPKITEKAAKVYKIYRNSQLEPYSKDIVANMAKKLFINIKRYHFSVYMAARWDLYERDVCPFTFKVIINPNHYVLLFDDNRAIPRPPVVSNINVGNPFPYP